MTRPESITICGQPFVVEWDATATTPLVDGEWNLGAANVSEQRILVRAIEQGDHQLRDTLLHEVLHSIVRMTGHRDDFKREEPVVYALATALLAVLRANPDLVAWLTEEVG